MKPEPFFMDAGGSTIRIDPPSTVASNFKLALITTAEHDNEGHTIQQGQVLELWLNTDQTRKLADALHAQLGIKYIE